MIQREYGLTQSLAIQSTVGKMELIGEMSWDLSWPSLQLSQKMVWRSLPGASGSEFQK